MPGSRSRTLKQWRQKCKIVNKSVAGVAGSLLLVAPATPIDAQSTAAAVPAFQTAETFEELAGRCAASVHPRTMAAVVMQESKGNPFAIGINGASQLPRQPRNEAEAIATARWLLAKGYNFDAGLGQINSANFKALGLDPSILFRPCENLRGAATVLTGCYSKASKTYGSGQAGLHGALSCYNTGNLTRGFRNGYVRKVVGQVSVPVPALLPSPGPIPQPSNKRAAPDAVERAAPAPSEAPPVREAGMGDAFSRSGRDAFAPPPAPEAPAPDNLDGADPRGPVVLTAVRADS